MNSILGCKMYKASSRKREILAAMQDPINQGLVQQLERYLGEEFRSPPQPKEEKPPQPKGAHEERSPEDKGSAGSSFGGGSFGGGPGAGTEGFDIVDSFGNEEVPSPSEGEGTGEPAEGAGDNSTEAPPAVEEGRQIDGTPVVASTSINGIFNPTSDLAPMKGLLNAQESTTGVNRILVKGDELWVYYEDSINLNNVMGPAIEILNAAPYTWIEFNRLARSDNAIVFVILPMTTDQVAPVSDDGKKT